MALEHILTDGSETGSSAALKINTGFAQNDVAATSIDTIITNADTLSGRVDDLEEASTSLTKVATSYTVKNTDVNILVDCTIGNTIITLPLAVTINKTLYIKRIDISTNTCSIVVTGTELIDGNSSIELTVYDAATLLSDRTDKYYIL